MSQLRISDSQIDKILDRHIDLQAKLSGQLDTETFIRLSKNYAELAPVADKALALRDARREHADLTALLADGGIDAEMAEMAREELAVLDDRLPELDYEMQIMLLEKDEADDKGAILELRAGTGGEEAALFAGNLFNMYSRYAELHGWKVEVMSASESDLGGYKEIIASISGSGVYARLKFEAGTHRVQRVPETEGGGRIHTSAATVAVLPEAEDVDMDIADADLRIDIYRASGAGGQHVNTTDSAIRITHVPTGLVVTCQDERSQHKNRAKAMKILRARLYEQQREQAASARAAERKGQVGSGDRSERIRTYNFPQGRVTDHRINLTLYKLDQIMAGEGLDEISDALISADQAARLSAVGDTANA